MATIAWTLRRIKQDLPEFVSEQSILDACLEARHRWRQRVLGPVTTVHLFILQVLCFNTAMTHLRHLAGLSISAAAYCKARQRLPLAVLQALLHRSGESLREASQEGEGHFCGHRVLLADGSSSIAPDTADSQAAFGQPKGQKAGCGFAVPKLIGLFDAFTGAILEMACFPLYTHEAAKVHLLHPLLRSGDLLVADRGFCSFVHVAMLSVRGMFACFRQHQKRRDHFGRQMRKKTRRNGKATRRSKGNSKRASVSSQRVRRLGPNDVLVKWFKPQKPKWIEQGRYDQLPDTLLVRQLRYTIVQPGYRSRKVTIATTLLDPVTYPRQKIAELYRMRWQAETHFADLKTTLKMRKVKCQSAQGVGKELAVYCLVYNLVRLVMLQAARWQGVAPQRISFIDTVRWLLAARPGEAMPDLLINPHRPHRHEPRVIKDRQDSYSTMTRPRQVLKKELLSPKGVLS